MKGTVHKLKFLGLVFVFCPDSSWALSVCCVFLCVAPALVGDVLGPHYVVSLLRVMTRISVGCGVMM